ncbi:AfsR/SARP family transcriptional regulator [Microbacterium sp. ASV49]|uniref:BTAD domain-containing putative transcriptional regulator n=1 Tax=Microbacterium candidum TaxID=3041922 RepID=A0ABT7N2H5_9MICO|nr:BTAD domain-containing putative transcriptional regulator [Microbacterium sp. ASV49]MDL9980865.1 BTAD domain-containing putative transcriptional regulator [Microbacterium sp. ASV49]
MAEAQILLFGPPRVRRGDAEVRFDTRKAVALLAVLAVTGQPHGRDALTELLWPDLPRANARSTLRRTLSVAAAIGPALVVDGDAIAVDPGACFCDVAEFRRLVGEGTLAAATDAVALVTGRFLEGLVLRDSPEFDDWRFGVERMLQDELSVTLRRLSSHAVRSGDFDAALSFARRRTEIDALSEPAHADLMLVTAWAGDRSGALRVYRDLVRRLDHALGVSPVPSTQALYHAIRTGATPPPPSPASRPRVQGAQPEVVRQLVAAAAVIGAPADAELLRIVSGRDEAEIAAALEDGVLQGSGEPRAYAVADPLVAAQALSALSLARRRLLHGRVAEALARRAGTVGEASAEAVGEHFADAGRDAEAAEWFALAAAAASERGDDSAALDAWRSAQAVGLDTVAVHLAVATGLLRLRRYAEALVALGRAGERAGDDAAALAAARQELAAAERSADHPRIVVCSSHLSDLLYAAGDEDAARAAQRRWAEALAELERDDAEPSPWTLSEW